MLSYGFSIRGKSHADTGTICQDANIHQQIVPGLYLAIAADGVGSALHSDIASGLAVEKLTEYVRQHISNKEVSADIKKECLKAGFRYAEEAIEDYVRDCGDKISDYDTTLHAVIYDGNALVYGHAGDGGIVARTTFGKTFSVTSPQKGSDGVSVMPLRAGIQSWEFGYIEEGIAAVMIVTDGILERVIMPYLLNLPANREEIQDVQRKKNRVYLSATEFFLNPFCVMGNRKVKDPLKIYQYFLTGEFDNLEKDWNLYVDCLKSGYRNMYGSMKAAEICQTITASVPLWNLEDTTDDKTVVCLINEGAVIHPPEKGYFMEPNWVELRKHYEHLLYPSGLQAQEDMQNMELEEQKDGKNTSKKNSGGFFRKLFRI